MFGRKKVKIEQTKEEKRKDRIEIFGTAAVFAVILFVYYVFRYGPYTGLYVFPPSPQKYVSVAMDMIDSQGIYCDSDAWTAVKTEVAQQAKSCESYEDTYEILNYALHVAGGEHSYLIPPGEAQEVNVTTSAVEMLDQGIMKITLPAFNGNEDEGYDYLNVAYEALREHQGEIKGVIVDLRGNSGGDMGPMLAAVAPLLPEGIELTYELSQQQHFVTIKTTKVQGGGTTMTLTDPFKINSIPVAVLQDETTKAEAEAVLLCFRGLYYTKSFGSATAGYTSVNNPTYLYDDACLVVTIGNFITRTQDVYLDIPVEPEVQSQDPEADALEWLLNYTIN